MGSKVWKQDSSRIRFMQGIWAGGFWDRSRQWRNLTSSEAAGKLMMGAAFAFGRGVKSGQELLSCGLDWLAFLCW